MPNSVRDINSYIRYFINGDSINDQIHTYNRKFNDPSLTYKSYKIAIEYNFELISINIFKISLIYFLNINIFSFFLLILFLFFFYFTIIR